MVNKRNWAAPGFTVLTLLALSACAGGGGGGGNGGVGGSPSTASGSGGGSPPPPPDFEVPNIYAAYGDEQPNQLENLLVFGDSYSDTERFSFDIWSEKLTDGIGGSSVESYAKGGAFAGPTNNYPGDDGNTIETQVDNWLATTPSFGGGDLTVFYAGYNDINVPKAAGEPISNQTALGRSADHLEDQIQRVIDAGATGGDRRVFVARVHEWTDIPKENTNPANFKAGFTDIWNDRIDQIANANDKIVAVDLNTVFRRIHDNPGDYGFTNVTTPDAANAGPGGTALYHDTVHFGERGQEIIAEVFNHYLTRGWDWANLLQAGSATAEERTLEINQGLQTSLAQLQADERLGFSSFFVGDREAQYAANLTDDASYDPARSGFRQLALSQEQDSGVGLNYAFDDDTMMGFVLSNNRQDLTDEQGNRSADIGYDSDAVSFYVNHEIEGFGLRTLVSYSNDSHDIRNYDDFVGQSDRATASGRTITLSQTASYPTHIGGAWWMPWLNVTHTDQKLDSFSVSNPYTSDVTYSSGGVADTLATIGFDMNADPIWLDRHNSVEFTASLTYTQSLLQEDYEVTMTEGAFSNVSQTDVIEREDVRQLGLRVGASFALGEDLSLSAGYLATQNLEASELDQSVQLRLGYSF